MKKDFLLLALATLFLLGCQTAITRTQIVSPYETPKYYGPIYPLTEAITLRYGEYPKTTISGSIEDEFYINGKHRDFRQIFDFEQTVLFFGPDLEVIAKLFDTQVTINNQKKTIDLSGTQIITIMSKRGEYKSSKITLAPKLPINDKERKEFEQTLKSNYLLGLSLPKSPISVGESFGAWFEVSGFSSGEVEIKFALTGVTYYQGRKNYHFDIIVNTRNLSDEGIDQRKLDGYALFDSVRGEFSYFEWAAYIRWKDNGHQNSRRILITRKLDTQNW